MSNAYTPMTAEEAREAVEAFRTAPHDQCYGGASNWRDEWKAPWLNAAQSLRAQLEWDLDHPNGPPVYEWGAAAEVVCEERGAWHRFFLRDGPGHTDEARRLINRPGARQVVHSSAQVDALNFAAPLRGEVRRYAEHARSHRWVEHNITTEIAESVAQQLRVPWTTAHDALVIRRWGVGLLRRLDIAETDCLAAGAEFDACLAESVRALIPSAEESAGCDMVRIAGYTSDVVHRTVDVIKLSGPARLLLIGEICNYVRWRVHCGPGATRQPRAIGPVQMGLCGVAS